MLAKPCFLLQNQFVNPFLTLQVTPGNSASYHYIMIVKDHQCGIPCLPNLTLEFVHSGGQDINSCWSWSSVSYPGISSSYPYSDFQSMNRFEGGGAFYIPLQIHQKYLKTIAVILDWAGEWEDNENYGDYQTTLTKAR